MENDKVSFQSRTKKTMAFRLMIFFSFFLILWSQKKSIVLADEPINNNNNTSSTVFRPGGHFTVLASVQQSYWDITNAGSIEYAHDELYAASMIFRYTFHSQLIRKVGLVVGTDMEVEYEPGQIAASSKCNDFTFKSGVNFTFPSLLLGLVDNINEKYRVMLLANYTAALYPMMQACNAENKPHFLLRAIPHSISASVLLDIFSSKTIAWSLGLGTRWRFIDCIGTPLICYQASQRNSALEKFSMSAFATFVELGLTWQPSSQNLWK